MWKKYIEIDEYLKRDMRIFYEDCSYLRVITEQELVNRVLGLLDNIAVVECNGIFSFPIKNNELGLAFYDTLYECEKRGIRYYDLFNRKIEYYLDRLKVLKLDKLKDCIQSNQEGEIICRYLEKRYIDYWKNGNIRFTLSRKYAESEYSNYINDDENIVKMKILGLRMTNLRTGITSPIKNSTITKSRSNYYISSYSRVLDPKIFVLLPYDSCLIINNTREYVSQIIEYIDKNEINNECLWNKVVYIDEYRKIPQKKGVSFIKTYLYQYQCESRFVVDDIHDMNKDHIEYLVEGNKKEYSTIIVV